MLLMLEQTGLFAHLKPQEGIASWSKPSLFGKCGVLGSRFCPTSLQRGCCRAPLVSLDKLFQVVYFWSLCPSLSVTVDRVLS